MLALSGKAEARMAVGLWKYMWQVWRSQVPTPLKKRSSYPAGEQTGEKRTLGTGLIKLSSNELTNVLGSCSEKKLYSACKPF